MCISDCYTCSLNSLLNICDEVVLIVSFNLQVYHPNIDLEGNVCLNILREDWKPVLNINTVIYGLFHLFTVLLIILQHLNWNFVIL